MWGWFGGSAAKSKDSPKKAILDLRSQLVMLQKRQQHLQNQVNDQEAAARKHVAASNTAAAKAALRRKKTHQHSLDQTEAQITTLEEQVNAIESANINRETLAAMERAGAAMKDIHGKLTVDKVDETMEELREQNALSEEIVNAITSSSVGNTVDEDELEGELEDLQQQLVDEQMLKTGNVPVHNLPSPANAEPVSKQAVEEDDEEAELRKLQAEMAM